MATVQCSGGNTGFWTSCGCYDPPQTDGLVSLRSRVSGQLVSTVSGFNVVADQHQSSPVRLLSEFQHFKITCWNLQTRQIQPKATLPCDG